MTKSHEQHKHAFGHAGSIAQQLGEYTALEVLYAMIGELVEDGLWPEVKHKWFHKAAPKPWSEADSALANTMIDKLHAFADIHGLWLMEYGENGVSERVYYGRKHED